MVRRVLARRKSHRSSDRRMASPAPESKEEYYRRATDARNVARHLMDLIGFLPDSYKRTNARECAESTVAWLERAMEDHQ